MNDAAVVPDASPRTALGPLDQSRKHVADARRHHERVTQAYAGGDPRQGGVHATRERMSLKYAEVAALQAIADELSRIGLAR